MRPPLSSPAPASLAEAAEEAVIVSALTHVIAHGRVPVARRATVSVDGDGMPRAGGVPRGAVAAVGAHCIGYLYSLPAGQVA